MLLIIELGDEVQNVRLNMYYVEEHLNLAARGGDVFDYKGFEFEYATRWGVAEGAVDVSCYSHALDPSLETDILDQHKLLLLPASSLIPSIFLIRHFHFYIISYKLYLW